MGRSPHRCWPVAQTLFRSLLVCCAATAFAAHSKPASIEPLDAEFHVGASGAIEASLNPPIQGVLRIVVRARASAGRSRQGSLAGDPPPQSERQPLTLEVTQWDRPIPFRLVHQSRRHGFFGSRPSSLVAEIDINDLTPGVPVRISAHSNPSSSPDSDPPGLEASAYAVVY